MTSIKSQVDKEAINTSPTNKKEIALNEDIAKELSPEYIEFLFIKHLKEDKRATVHQILKRHKIKQLYKSSSDMQIIILF